MHHQKAVEGKDLLLDVLGDRVVLFLVAQEGMVLLPLQVVQEGRVVLPLQLNTVQMFLFTIGISIKLFPTLSYKESTLLKN